MAVFYGLVGQVGDGVDRLAADNGGGFMEKVQGCAEVRGTKGWLASLAYGRLATPRCMRSDLLMSYYSRLR